MSEMKGGLAVALLVDIVASRSSPRAALHADVLRAVEGVNGAVESVHELRPTVGDELQGVYPTLGAALTAGLSLRLALAPRWDARCGVGGGEVVVVDEARGIQDGSGWWLAREAIDWVKAQAARPGYETVRTAIRDERAAATPSADAVSRLVDVHLTRLRPGALSTLRGMLEGLDNAEIADIEGISASANSQRVRNNDLRPLMDVIIALGQLP
ncbi:SatD family protein [Tessaracoccus sp. Z1128]